MPSATAKPPRYRRGKSTPRAGKAEKTDYGQRSFAQTLLANPRYAIRGVWIILAIHTLGLILIFQPVNGLFDANPLIDQDWGLHFHHLRSSEAF